jgi:hypothetical protein
MDYYYKYLKYKRINLDILNSMNIQLGGDKRYKCLPNEKFNDICQQDDNGLYNSKKSCINDCEGKYININLSISIIKHERFKFVGFIKDLMEMGVDVYIVGGNALGLKVLKMIYDKYSGNEFEKYFNRFLEMELIKDWDFSGYTKKDITDEFHEKLDKLAKKHNLVSRAKTFILYQTNRPILTDEKALFEINVQAKDNFSSIELPLTRMKVKINKNNLKYIFMFANSFLDYKTKNKPFDLDLIKHMISRIDVNILDCNKGLIVVNPNTFDTGNLSSQMLNIIDEYKSESKEYKQFLITQIKDPSRILYRLLEKNIPKNKKIYNFIKDNNLSNGKIQWIFDDSAIKGLIKRFIKKLSDSMIKIFKQYNIIEPIVENIDSLYMNIDMGKIENSYEDFGKEGLGILKDWFIGIYELIGKDNIKKLNDIIESDNNLKQKEKNKKIIHILYFLDRKGLFK